MSVNISQSTGVKVPEELNLLQHHYKNFNCDIKPKCDSNFYSKPGAAILYPVPPNFPVQYTFVFSSSASTNLNNQDKYGSWLVG